MIALRRLSLVTPILLLPFVACDRVEPVAPVVEARVSAGSGPTPNAPSNSNAVAASYDRIDVSWQDNSSTESGFELHRSTTGPSGVFTLVTSTGANVTSSSNGGLTASTQYCYKVRAFRTTGGKTSSSAFSPVSCATTLAPPLPAAPSSANATPRFGFAITVAWTDNSGNEAGFRVERSSTSGGPWTVIRTTSPNVTSRDDYPFFDVEQLICYRVLAFNSYGDSGPSNVDCTTPPAAPTGLTAAVADDGTVALSWTDNSGVEDGYVVLRGDAGGSGMSAIATLPANATGYREAALDGTYGYVVRATKDGGTSLSSSNFVQVVVATAPPSPPPNVDAVPQSSSVVSVTWTDGSNNEEGFRVERSADGGASWVTYYTAGMDNTALWDDGAAPEQQVCYRVIAFNAKGDSPPSNTDCTTPPAGPTSFSASGVDSITVDFAWTDNSGVEDGYQIGIDYGYGYWEIIASVGPNTTSYRLQWGAGVYYNTYFVVAIKDGGYSDFSNLATPQP